MNYILYLVFLSIFCIVTAIASCGILAIVNTFLGFRSTLGDYALMAFGLLYFGLIIKQKFLRSK